MLIEMPAVDRRHGGRSAFRIADQPTHVPATGLAGSDLADRFCFWRGRSGRRYVFSVYPFASLAGESLPRYPDAVIVIARRESDGTRIIVRVGDSGSLPEAAPVLTEALREWRAGDELHVHLMASGRAARRAVLDDLAAAERS